MNNLRPNPGFETEPTTISRPLIGITMRLELGTDRFYLARHYSEAVAAAGGTPVHISLIPRREYISAIIEHLDGVLLPGSDSDVDPLRYGAEPHPNLGSVQAIKDETDLLVLEEVENRKLPLFAICFGMQVLNVFRGGTLIQDIGSQVPKAIKHAQGPPRDRPSHRIKLANNTQLSHLARTESTLVNSHHHQAIENLGRNLVATAWASDGLIEAVEDPRADRFALAVQWHPELGWERDELSQLLFKRFIQASGEYRAREGSNARSVQRAVASVKALEFAERSK
jgi:putative glutamine amidotransferase